VLDEEKLALGRGLRTRRQTVYRTGDGPPIVWLHGLNGVSADEPFIARLANGHSVIAPVAPGFDDLDELLDLRNIHELALLYDDLLDRSTSPAPR
jgi:pimeloyl-ACP methyl ester carboxylesterase